MADDLKNRARLGITLKKELAEKFQELAEETRIPKTRLMDEAVEDLLKKHKKA